MLKSCFKRLPILLLTVLLLLPVSGEVSGQNMQGYYPGDWVSFTTTRFATSVAIGWSDIYFGTMGGIIQYNSVEKKWRNPITKSDGLPSSDIWRIAVNRANDVIWVETPLGVYSYNPVFQHWYFESDFPDELVTSRIDAPEYLQPYILDVGYNLTYEDNYAVITDPQLRSYRVIDAIEDDWDHIWLATYGQGIARVDQSSGYVTLIPFGLYQDNINTVLIDGTDVWFGGKPDESTENAITVWRRDESQWEYFEATYMDWIVSDYVNDIVADKSHVYFATDFGLVKYRKSRNTFTSYTRALGLRSTAIQSLYLEDSLLFMGGDGVIDVLLTTRDSIFPLQTSIPAIGTVLSMSHIGSNFWVGTDYGVHRFDEVEFKWSRYNVPSGYLGGAVWQFAEGDDGDVWFAGIDGVVHVDKNLLELETFLTRHELGNSVPHRIAFTDDFLWIGTDKGLYRYEDSNDRWKQYTVYEGLISDYVNDMVLEGDYLWIATPEGVTRFYWNNDKRIRDD